MKGIVFNLLEHCVRQECGEDAWDSVLESAGLEGAYASLGSYPDEDLGRIVAAASEAFKMTPDGVTRWFGRSALPLLAEKYPSLFAKHGSARSFLLSLNDIIHPEVRKLYPGVDVPEFEYDTSSDETLVMTYTSARRLCSFAEGLIEGAAQHFGEELKIERPRCMKRGDLECELRITLRRRECREDGH